MTQPRKFGLGRSHGARTIEGIDQYLNRERVRRIGHIKNLAPAPKNALNNPYSYLQVLEELLELDPGNDPFTAADLVESLDMYKDKMRWDAYTVGRIVIDLAETLQLKFGTERETPIQIISKSNRNSFLMSYKLENRIAMENLLTDLYNLCERDFDLPKGDSMLGHCQSLNG